MRRAPRWLASVLLCLPTAATADTASKLAAFEAEAASIGQNLPTPHEAPLATGARRLVDAQVAFSIGDYNTAALALFELASTPGPDQETATYYLAESLFQKRDRGAARTYFGQVVASNNVASRYYQPSLVRLIEIAIAQQDLEEAQPHVSALDRLSPGLRQPVVPYVRGKLAFADGKYDEALAYFQDVPKGSEYELQAAYYMGTTNVAKKDLNKARGIFADLIERRPKTARDRRVIELSQLALARIHYELDQPSKAIDAYLLVDRHSDLFPDALYEVAWVYVKGKQYDKALRALELLALSEPQSNKTPTVRLLEGNLRIRKAQRLREAIITNTIEADAPTPDSEYEKASKVFGGTHAAYHPSYAALAQMVDGQMNPEQFLAQLSGRSTQIFQAAMPIPEAAAQALREDPRVARAIGISGDLGEIESNIAQAEATIERLGAVFEIGDRDAVYPVLASRRSRLGQLQDELIVVRNDLAEQQLRLVDTTGELAQLTARRKTLAQGYTAGPNAEQMRTNVAEADRGTVDRLEDDAGEVASTIDKTQAMVVALRVFAGAANSDGTPLVSTETKDQITQTLEGAMTEAAAIEQELAQVRRDMTLRRDLAGIGDPGVANARKARNDLVAAQNAEHRVLAGFASASRDRGRSQGLAALGDRAARISDQLAVIEKRIDALVDAGMTRARTMLAQERENVESYKTELRVLDADAREIGGTALGSSFKRVKATFYDIVVRSDVGAIDVVWSQKEDADDDLKRINLSRTRELKQLRDEFKDILDSMNLTTPGTPTPAPAAPAAGSPDQGGAGDRVSPGSGAPATPAAPTVRPDNETQKGGAR